MTDSRAGDGQPLYGRLNINYTGNTNYDTWSHDIVTNYNTYDSKADQYKAAEKAAVEKLKQATMPFYKRIWRSIKKLFNH